MGLFAFLCLQIGKYPVPGHQKHDLLNSPSKIALTLCFVKLYPLISKEKYTRMLILNLHSHAKSPIVKRSAKSLALLRNSSLGSEMFFAPFGAVRKVAWQQEK